MNDGQAFDVGFIPAGWEKGEELRVRKASQNTRGTVSQKNLPSLFDPKRVISCDDIAYCHFGYGEGDKVSEWLKWWFE